jgi:hypothetical protein
MRERIVRAAIEAANSVRGLPYPPRLKTPIRFVRTATEADGVESKAHYENAANMAYKAALNDGRYAVEWTIGYSGEPAAEASILRCILGNPFRAVTISPSWQLWNEKTISRIAEAIYDERAFDRMPILADALEEAGCTNADILNHCRQPDEHVRGCWVVDLLLGKGRGHASCISASSRFSLKNSWYGRSGISSKSHRR